MVFKQYGERCAQTRKVVSCVLAVLRGGLIPPVGLPSGVCFCTVEVPVRGTQQLRWPILLSLMVHSSVLFSLRNAALIAEPAISPSGLVISARLMPAGGETQAASPQGAAPRPLPLPAESPVQRNLAQDRVKAERANLPTFSPLTAPVDAIVTERGAGQPGRSPPVASASVLPPDAPSADGLRQYRLNLAREARRFKRYPAQARERGWEGVVVVVVNTVAGADRPQVMLSQSSGFEILDQEALDLVTQAIRTALIPDSLHGRLFGLTLPIHYHLDE